MIELNIILSSGRMEKSNDSQQGAEQSPPGGSFENEYSEQEKFDEAPRRNEPLNQTNEGKGPEERQSSSNKTSLAPNAPDSSVSPGEPPSGTPDSGIASLDQPTNSEETAVSIDQEQPSKTLASSATPEEGLTADALFNGPGDASGKNVNPRNAEGGVSALSGVAFVDEGPPFPVSQVVLDSLKAKAPATELAAISFKESPAFQIASGPSSDDGRLSMAPNPTQTQSAELAPTVDLEVAVTSAESERVKRVESRSDHNLRDPGRGPRNEASLILAPSAMPGSGAQMGKNAERALPGELAALQKDISSPTPEGDAAPNHEAVEGQTFKSQKKQSVIAAKPSVVHAKTEGALVSAQLSGQSIEAGLAGLPEAEVSGTPESRQTTGPSAQLQLTRAEAPIHVSRQLAEAMQRLPDRPVEVALNPEELGRVRMAISASETGITVSVLAERSETLDMLRRHIDQLAREFQSIGYENINFDFAQGDTPQDTAADHEAEARDDLSEGDIDAGDANPTIYLKSDAALDVRL